MDREPFMETKSVLRAYRTRKAITKKYNYKNQGEQPRQEELCLAVKGELCPKVMGIKIPEEKSLNFI